MRPQGPAVTRVFCLGGLEDWKLTVLLLLSVQVQYPGPGS